MAKKPKAEKATETNVPVNAKIGKNEPHTSREFLRKEFTPEEIEAKGRKLAQLTADKKKIENDKKAANSNFKATLDGKTAEIEILMNDIMNGFGQQYVDCRVETHTPNSGMQTIFRIDTGEKVRVESMPMEALQTELALHDEPVGDQDEETEDVDDKE